MIRTSGTTENTKVQVGKGKLAAKPEKQAPKSWGIEASGKMKAIDFVVRDEAGALSRGIVSEGAPRTDVALISGQQVSFNLGQTDILAQRREGDTLVLILNDGREVWVDNYFNEIGTPNRLFVSTDGYLNEVTFVDTGGGDLFAQYGETQQWGKWSPADDLIFLGRTEVAALPADEEVSMLAPALLAGSGLLGTLGAGAAGLAAVAAIGSGVGDDDGGPGTPTGPGNPPAQVEPTVDNAGETFSIGGDDSSTHTLTVTGAGPAGAAVTVKVGGQSSETVIGPDGRWSVTMSGDGFPTDGSHDTTVEFVIAGRDDVELDGPDFRIDTTPPEVAITSGTDSTGDLVNAASYANGVTLSGTGEAGAELTVTIEGIARTTTIAQDGSWSLTWETGVLQEGDYSSSVSVVARDSFGNSTTLSDTLVVDTVTQVTITTPVEGDNIINASEESDGVVLTGTAQPDSRVEVTFAGQTQTVSAGSDGAWSVAYAAGQIASGEYSSTVSVTATDPAGNTATQTAELQVDTLVNALSITSTTGGSDGVINNVEAQAGFTVTGEVEPGSGVSVTMGSETVTAQVAADGTWSANFTAAQIPAGTYSATLTATATDAAGNTATATQVVNVDTEASQLTLVKPIETDDVVNGVEQSDGVLLTGTAEAGATVEVTLGTETVMASVDAAGNWQAAFSAAQVPVGEYGASITVRATDAAGNVSSMQDTVRVDTLVNQLTLGNDLSGNIANAAAAQDGISFSGQVEAGSSVVVNYGGQNYAATVDASGNWSLDVPPGDIAPGEYDVAVQVTATDAAGNTDSVSETISIDTQAPEGPVIASYTRDEDGIRGITTELSDGTLAAVQVGGDGSLSEIEATQANIEALGETAFQFAQNVPDGSHLVITASDDAGNTAGTYVVLDDESANSSVDLSNPALGTHQIETVDLQFAEEANLTITEAQLLGLSSTSDTLTVHGGSDDSVSMTGAQRTGTTQIDGQTYSVYSLGDTGRVIIDDDIQVGGVV